MHNIFFHIRMMCLNFKKMKRLFKSIKIQDGNFVLYRAIRLNEEDEPVKEELGCHWTFDYKKAYPYGGKGTRSHYFIYKALVPFSSVDMNETLLKHYGPFDEKEVVLHKNKRVNLIAVEKVEDLLAYRKDGKWMFPRRIKTQKTNVKCVA
jgi:hypothetical protein